MSHLPGAEHLQPAGSSAHKCNLCIMGSIGKDAGGAWTPPLSPDRPRWDFALPGCAAGGDGGGGGGGEHLLITVCLHGNEPCGMLAANELLQEGFFDFAAGKALATAWDRLTVLLGNPAGVKAGKRFVDNNLNRLFTPDEAQLAAAGGGGIEHRRVPELAAAIEQSTQHVDIHSSSAASPPFCFHFPGAESAAYATSFPVAYAIEDTSIQGTSIHWAHQKGKARSILVECGQHDARETVEVAKRCIRRLVLGPEAMQAAQPHTLRTAGSVYVGRGFRWRGNVTAFQLVEQGEVIAEDDEHEELKCPHAQARLVMPTQLPVAGEEAFMWGVEREETER